MQRDEWIKAGVQALCRAHAVFDFPDDYDGTDTEAEFYDFPAVLVASVVDAVAPLVYGAALVEAKAGLIVDDAAPGEQWRYVTEWRSGARDIGPDSTRVWRVEHRAVAHPVETTQ